MLGGVQRAEEARHRLEVGEHVRFRQVPDGLGLEGRLGQVERTRLEGRAVADRLALVADDLLRDGHSAEGGVEAEPPLRAQLLVDGGRRLLLRLRVPVAAERLDERAPGAEVELADEVALAEVEVDGTFVNGRVRALALDEAEHRAGRDVHDGERLRARRAERDARRRVVAA